MHKRVFNAVFILNILFQALLSLVAPAALTFLLAWLLVSRCSFPEWVYAVAIILGLLAGLVSMVRFIISATGSLERLEKEQNKKDG